LFDDAPDYAALCDYLRWGYVPAPRTIYRSASKLAPAHYAKVTSSGLLQLRYFDPNAATPATAATDEPTAARVRALVRCAVERRLISDVPLGCFLSGGIDSSIIAAAMKMGAPAGQPVMTFSIGFDDPRYDETPYAEAVASHLGTRHQTFRVRPDAASDLPKLARVFGEPFADSSALPTHYLARETRQHVKVALSGDGGDELFGGYDRYRALQLSSRLPNFLRPLLASRRWQALPGTHPKSRSARLKRFLAGVNDAPARQYAAYLRLFDDRTIASLLRLDLRGNLSAQDEWVEQAFERFAEDRDLVPAALATDRVTYLPDDLLTKVDRSSMLHALEVRSPFMDHELVSFAASFTADDLLAGGGKRLLREAFVDDLPGEVFTRPKMGFAVPIGQWLRRPLRDMLHDLLFSADSFATAHFEMQPLRELVDSHEREIADHSQRLYALLMLELWHRG
jgi:asparagine synthase (glutamine-hydrolysing)